MALPMVPGSCSSGRVSNGIKLASSTELGAQKGDFCVCVHDRMGGLPPRQSLFLSFFSSAPSLPFHDDGPPPPAVDCCTRNAPTTFSVAGSTSHCSPLLPAQRDVDSLASPRPLLLLGSRTTPRWQRQRFWR